MKLIRRFLRTVRFLILLALFAGAGLWLFLENAHWGYARAVSSDEQTLRGSVVSVAEGWLGANEADGTHREIIDLYNAQDVLAQDYEVKYSDNWCAAFASAVAIQCDLTDIIPTECGCQRQIGLWEQLGRWEEDDNYVPLPGDYIYYAWDEGFDLGDCIGWADHVGIVVGTCGPFLKVIEGNKGDAVSYRIILVGDYRIRGYGLPDYRSKTA
ncbi:MAG: hypothetical protein PUH32_03295 [Firmicutes bacterium]|nr:hypothetical protein [Bacillota bacterium]